MQKLISCLRGKFFHLELSHMTNCSGFRSQASMQIENWARLIVIKVLYFRQQLIIVFALSVKKLSKKST